MKTKVPKAPTSAPTDLPPAMTRVPEERVIPASQFIRYPYNRVPKPDAVAELSHSIREVGQLQPITCRSNGRAHADAPEEFEIIFGETRWLGCQMIHPDFPVRAYVLATDDKETARIHAVENFQRRDLDEIEEAESIKNMRDQGWSIEEIMTSIGREKSHIYLRLTILKLDDAAKQAIRDKNLSLRTAEVIAQLPEGQREAALKACIEPKYLDRALPERDAMAMLKREFVEPAKLAAEWAEKRDLLEKEHPGAQWLGYDEARKFVKERYAEIEPASETPDAYYLTEAAQAKESIELPTWGELARKHGLPGIIALEQYGSEAVLYIPTLPVISAERESDPESFFSDPAVEAVDAGGDGKDAETARRKAEHELAQALDVKIEGERLRLIEHVMSRKNISATATRKLVAHAFEVYIESSYAEWDSIEMVFPGVDRDADVEIVRDHARAEFAKLLKEKGADPFIVLARVMVANELAKANGNRYAAYADSLASFAFTTGAFKRSDYPALNERFPEPPKVVQGEEQSQPEGESATA